MPACLPPSSFVPLNLLNSMIWANHLFSTEIIQFDSWTSPEILQTPPHAEDAALVCECARYGPTVHAQGTKLSASVSLPKDGAQLIRFFFFFFLWKAELKTWAIPGLSPTDHVGLLLRGSFKQWHLRSRQKLQLFATTCKFFKSHGRIREDSTSDYRW